jgi:spore germination protein PF
MVDMPALVGPVSILNIGGGNVQFGDTGIISPKNASKTYGGSGGFNTGPFQLTYNVFSATTTFDCNVVDQPIAGNN